MSQVLAGERKAFVTLVKQHQRLVAHMVGRVVKVDEEREEICQDVFMRVYQKLGEFKFQSRLSTWIATIAYRQAINHLQKMRPHMLELPADESYSAHFVEPENPEMVLEERDTDEVVLKLIDRLPAQYKMVLSLYHLESMNYEEIGDITGMPEGTVKSYLFRARNMIKETIKKYLAKEELR
ncbi:MAG: sigma-70 family RNA polymerase sigma factor [Bacteroidia bacterium]|nr:sigma-70 family RNA polymerase sigma factor [Bacteroidia bacterium]